MAQEKNPDLRSEVVTGNETTKGETSPAQKYREALDAGDDPHQDFVLVIRLTRSKGVDWWKELGLVEAGKVRPTFTPSTHTGRFLRHRSHPIHRFPPEKDLMLHPDGTMTVRDEGSSVEGAEPYAIDPADLEDLEKRIASAMDEARERGQFMVMDDMTLVSPEATPKQRVVVNDLLATVSAAVSPTGLVPYDEGGQLHRRWQGKHEHVDTVLMARDDASPSQAVYPTVQGFASDIARLGNVFPDSTPDWKAEQPLKLPGSPGATFSMFNAPGSPVEVSTKADIHAALTAYVDANKATEDPNDAT
jgi:hypothetical protein